MNYYSAINWNNIEDQIDKSTWEKLTEQFWLDTRIPLSNDLDDWRALSEKEKKMVGYVFGGLTLLDTIQSESAIDAIRPDVRTPHEEAVLSNIQFMECMTKGHKLLTTEGWRDISDIKKGDLVLQYNIDGSTQFENVLNTSSHIPDKLYHFSNKKYDLKVSGGHRMIYEQMSQNNKGDGWKIKEVTAKDYMNESCTYYKRDILHSDRFVSVNKDSRLTPIERLIIATQADGSINKKRRNRDTINRLDIRFSFSKNRKIKRLKEIVDKAGILDDISITEVKKRNEKRNFSVKINKNILKDFNSDKLFSDYFKIDDFSQSKADEFIEELSHWDSHISKTNDNVITYYTTSRENSDFVKAVATLSSWYYTFGTNEDNRKETYKDSHYVRLTKNKFSSRLTFQSERIKEEIETEMVYGVEVPSTYLVVLTTNGLVVTGNCVHAKSYSSIFSTLNTKSEIDKIFEWTNTNEFLQKKAKIINEIYKDGSPLQKKVASVYAETFLFYSGFFAPLYYLGNNKLANVAEIIKLIIRDESVHGTYIGYKFQLGFNQLTEDEQAEMEDWMYNLLYELYENEEGYTDLLYGELGWQEEVKTFLRYNANKALMNLGVNPLFPDTANDVNPIVMNGLSTGTSNHDFFSQVGNGYLLGSVEVMNDDDYMIGVD